jgi:hypothetical protein
MGTMLLTQPLNYKKKIATQMVLINHPEIEAFKWGKTNF